MQPRREKTLPVTTLVATYGAASDTQDTQSPPVVEQPRLSSRGCWSLGARLVVSAVSVLGIAGAILVCVPAARQGDGRSELTMQWLFDGDREKQISVPQGLEAVGARLPRPINR